MRGLKHHNDLVDLAATALTHAGFVATRECPMRLPDGRMDSIDVLALRGTDALACEVETTPRSVVSNTKKALALRLPLMIIVPNRKVGRQVRSALTRSGLLQSDGCAGSDTDRSSGSRASSGGGGGIWILLIGQLSRALRDCFPHCRSANEPQGNGQTNTADLLSIKGGG